MSLPDPVLGDTVMHYAVKQQRYLELREMLNHGGNPFVKNKEGKSVASMMERFSFSEGKTIEENSIRMGIATDSHSSNTDAAVSTVQKCQNSKIIQEINMKIEEMKTVENVSKENNESLLHRAVRQNNLKRVKLYQKLGASFHSFNQNGQTPEELANELSHTEILSFLKEKNKNLVSQDLNVTEIETIEMELKKEDAE